MGPIQSRAKELLCCYALLACHCHKLSPILVPCHAVIKLLPVVAISFVVTRGGADDS